MPAERHSSCFDIAVALLSELPPCPGIFDPPHGPICAACSSAVQRVFDLERALGDGASIVLVHGAAPPCAPSVRPMVRAKPLRREWAQLPLPSIERDLALVWARRAKPAPKLGPEPITVTPRSSVGVGFARASGLLQEGGDWHRCESAGCALGHGTTEDPRQLRLRGIDHHLDYAWRPREVRRHHRESALADQAGDVSRALWHDRRAGGVGRKLAQRVGTCGEAVDAVVSCRGCGTRHAMPSSCKVRQVCGRCAKAWSKRVSERMAHSLWVHLQRDRAAWAARGCRWRQRPLLSMLTLTIKHSGDLARDRATLQKGWTRLRSWLRKRLGYSITFARTAECTEGNDGLGHVHWHVVCSLPWVDYRDLQHEWARATAGAAVVGPGLKVTRYGGRKAPGRAASYIAKYATKGCGGLSDLMAAKWTAASWGQRAIATSVGFWQSSTRSMSPCCSAPFSVVAAGLAARELAEREGRGPGATWSGARPRVVDPSRAAHLSFAEMSRWAFKRRRSAVLALARAAAPGPVPVMRKASRGPARQRDFERAWRSMGIFDGRGPSTSGREGAG